jgi:hypothetical protein
MPSKGKETIVFKVSRQTGYFYCDGCRREVEEPVFELTSDVRSTVGFYYRCRACALKRVPARALEAAVKRGEESGARARELASKRARPGEQKLR